MPRQPKPYLRKQTKSWYCSIAGRQIPRGKNRELVFEKFHELMADQGQVKNELTTLYDLSQAYLDWCQGNGCQAHIASTDTSSSPSLGMLENDCGLLSSRYITLHKWHEGLGVGSTTQNDAVATVQRMLNWAVEQEYLYRNPIKGMKKPKRKRRDVYYTSAQWAQIREHAKEPFTSLLDFLFLTGCRPQEARAIEARHLHEDLVIFPADESKGEIEPRVIYLVPEAKEVLVPLAKQFPDGALFRNGEYKY